MIQIARDLGYTVVERDIARAELYLAEEVFLTGTAAEMVPVREIDDHAIGGPGEITRHVQAKFMDALHGRAEEYLEWLDFVDVPADEAGRRARRRPDRRRGDRVDRRDDRANYPSRLAAGAAGSGRAPGSAVAPGPIGSHPISVRNSKGSTQMEQVKLYDTTLRDGMQGEGMSLSAAEKVRVVEGARRPRRADDRGRLPQLQPEGRGALRLARRASSWSAASSAPSA